MALLLGAFLIHGIAPGPDMLGKHLDITFTLIWTVALANILGAGACFLFAGQFARIATLRAGILVPLVFAIMLVGAYQGAQEYADLVVLVLAGALGWLMKRLGWPRPPLILAFVLGGLIENYLFISQLRYGFGWMLRAVPMVAWLVMALVLMRPLFSRMTGLGASGGAGAPVSEKTETSIQWRIVDTLLWAGAAALFVYVYLTASPWEFAARLMPQTLSVISLAAIAAVGILALFGKVPPTAAADRDVSINRILIQGLWLVGLVFGVAIIGMLPAMAVFIVAYMVVEGRLSPLSAVLIMVPFWIATFVLFHQIMHMPWPLSYIGDWLPELRKLTSQRIL
jgi:hypothetical protein